MCNAIGSSMSYEDFLDMLVDLCEKAYRKKKIATQTNRSFFMSCCDMEKKKTGRQDLTVEEFLQYTTDSIVEKENLKKEKEKDKDPEMKNAPWRKYPPPLPKPPSREGAASGLCI